MLEAVPGLPELASNSKLVLLSSLLTGLMASDVSAFWGSVRVRVGSAIATVREGARVACQAWHGGQQ